MSDTIYWPDDPTLPLSVAHKDDWAVARWHPTRLVPWHQGHAPDLECGHNVYTQGRGRSCGYCGSMHPIDLAAALKAGALTHWADFKYGWPHKLYVDGIPNPHAGKRCTVMSTGYGTKKGAGRPEEAGEWIQLMSPNDLQLKEEFQRYSWHHVSTEAPTTWGKFYTRHLLDATPQDRDVIEKAMGLHVKFGDSIWWRPYGTPDPAEQMK